LHVDIFEVIDARSFDSNVFGFDSIFFRHLENETRRKGTKNW
jgi:hypothetical protein